MPSPELPGFAMLVRDKRRKLGLSQKALAERAGLPMYRVEEVEQGRWPKKNYLKTLLALARTLGLKASDLDQRLNSEF
ncbi:MAG TPA: helix-turn-helix transcriptional regulator [Gemmataceae bacterium]|nr:helix-turn-helix transcriptional regulator [Gemmataceae bacterium]